LCVLQNTHAIVYTSRYLKPTALAIVVTLLWGMIADRTEQYYFLIVGLQVLMIVSNILLAVWSIPKGALMFAYYLSYAGSATTPVLVVRNTQSTED
jgi:MFS transporter, ACS family, pantothenate transporter